MSVHQLTYHELVVLKALLRAGGQSLAAHFNVPRMAPGLLRDAIETLAGRRLVDVDRDDDGQPVALSLTDASTRWLGASVSRREAAAIPH